MIPEALKPGIDPAQLGPVTTARSESILRRRIRKFRRLKRGYYSFLIIVVAYAVSFFLPFLMSGTPIVVKYQGRYFFPMLRFHNVTEFGAEGFGEPDYRSLKKLFAEAGGDDWVLMAPYPYGPNESLLDLTSPTPQSTLARAPLWHRRSWKRRARPTRIWF